MKSAVKVINNIINGKFMHISRFSMVGAANTFIDFFIFTISHGLFGFNYIYSQVLGYSFGILNSFIFNKKWTFGDRHSNKKKFYEFFEFIVVNLITLITTIIVMNFLVQDFNLNIYMSKIIVTMLAQTTNFILYKFWVFI